jgi:septal ring factor EnvC (AmiA/AmiB activator)
LEAGATPPTPPGQPPADPDSRPATAGDLRTLRRWLIVAGVWAVAATAIAVIALLNANDAKDKATSDTASSLQRATRDLDNRVDKLEQDVAGLPTAEQLDDLESQIKDLDKQVSTAQDDAKSADDATTKLEEQVQALEDAANSGTNTTTTP